MFGGEILKNASVQGIIRPVGFFYSSDLLGFFAFYSMLVFYLFDKNKIWFLMSIALLLMSTSKSSYLMLLIFLIVIMLYSVDKKDKTLAFCGCVFLAFVAFFSIFFNYFFDILINFLKKTLSSRDYILVAASLEDRFINGWLDAFEAMWSLSFVELLFGHSLANDEITKDNMYFFIIHNFGIVFLLLFFTFLIKIIYKNIKILIVVLPFLYAGIFLDIFENIVWQIYFYVIIFLLIQKIPCRKI